MARNISEAMQYTYTYSRYIYTHWCDILRREMLVKLGLNKAIPSVARNALLRNGTKGSIGMSMYGMRSFSTVNNVTYKEKPFIEINSLESGESELLISQRKSRPISPHLTIYQPQLTWYLSSVHRISLVLLGAGFYALTILFAVGAILGPSDKINTEKVTNWYHNTTSKITQISLKTTFAYLFAFHYALSVRHAIWDAAKELTLKGVYRTGYTAMGFGVLVGTYLLSL